jgi:uncharacterized protein (UPF0333 family)
MKKKFNFLILVVLLILSLSVLTWNKSEARSSVKNSTEAYSGKSDLFQVIRVQENGHWYIYIYTDNGQYVAKFEEL